MKFTFVNLAILSLFIVLFLSACGSNGLTNESNTSSAENANQIGAANAASSNSVKDDIDELGKIIKLPLLPEDANFWEENVTKTDGDGQTSVQNGKKIIAVLKFSPENAAQLTAQIEKIKPPIDSEIDAESRFPAELIARSQLSGDESLKGKSYAADDFFQMPFTNGKITRIENSDYFVLELTTP
jgi:ABC-type Fe3+-hydroxamate transport system substrate-binding protein